ncbi:uncharacterized protein LOC141609432 isoform X2 [Silene latifolia]|uniref:uncharacterized protein LOC141609432 isoform X2 n=1 Tax=Silene latifolia TaxID=37657 RepID=UPI003D782F4B
MLRNFRSLLGMGRIFPASRTCEYWKDAEELVPEIIDKYKHNMESPPVGPGRLTKLNVQAATGVYYYLTLRIKREDGFIATYEAKALLQVGNLGTKILSFEKVPGSETKSKNSKTEKTESTKKMGKKGLDIFKGLSLPLPMTNSEFDSGEQIRSQRSWNYSRAKKCASTIWKELSESEKMVFLSEAAKRSEKN